MCEVKKYGRIQFTVPDGCERVTIICPDGSREEALTFRYQPTRFLYDEHGYETQEMDGSPFTAFRYTPVLPGEYRYIAAGEEGGFRCVDSDEPGFVQVSKKDPRYFATGDGHAFVPVGPNLCILRAETRPASQAHFVTGDCSAWMGLTSYRRWIRRLKNEGVNYVRLWLCTPYLNARTQIMGKHNLPVFNRLDAIMDLLRESGIRVKMCLENFLIFTRPDLPIFNKVLIDPDTGLPVTDTIEWISSEKWNNRWLDDIRPYIARYQNDPMVLAWELWNENNGYDAPGEYVIAFNRRMLDRVHALSPRNLVVNSLGSYDREEFLHDYLIPFRDTENMPFMQIHRYLDQGSPLRICANDPVELVADAFERVNCTGKPCVLNETAAVNDCHTGPFRFYPADDDGLIFTDLTYTPFFCGSSDSGHLWHWEYYIEPKNLWKHYRPFIEMLKGIEVDEEHFVPGRDSDERAHVLRLDGQKHTLIYVRSRLNPWQKILRDGEEPTPLSGLSIAVPEGHIQVFWLMNEQRETALNAENGQITLPAFHYGCVIRIDHR